MPFILLCFPISRSSAIFFSLLLQEHIRGFPWWFIAFQRRGCRFDPWLGSQDPTCLATIKKKKNIKQKQYCNKFNKDLKKKKKRTNQNSNLHSGKQEFSASPGMSFQDLGEQKAAAPKEISHLNMQMRKRIKGSGVTYGEHSGKVQRLGT